MKRIATYLLLSTAALLCLMSREAFGQSPAARPNTEQSLQEILSEVRQLRVVVQRMSAAAYKGQILLGRLRLQQEQVARLAREARDVREKAGETKARLQKIRAGVEQREKEVGVGLRDEKELTAMKAEVDSLEQREQGLAAQETQVLSELEAERGKLAGLEGQLNMLDKEVLVK